MECAVEDDSAGRGHVHSDTGCVSGTWLWARLLTAEDEDVGFDAIEKLSACFEVQMQLGQFEAYHIAFFEAKGDFEGTIAGIENSQMPDLMWVALFVRGGHVDVVTPLRELFSSSGEPILDLPLPS